MGPKLIYFRGMIFGTEFSNSGFDMLKDPQPFQGGLQNISKENAF